MATTSSLLGGANIKSIQTGYVTGNATSTGEDSMYVDDTLSTAVVVANCVVIAQGYNSTEYGTLTGRVTSTTNVRLSFSGGQTGSIKGRYYVIEYDL